MEQLTDELLKQAKELYHRFKVDTACLVGLPADTLEDYVHNINAYEVMDSFSDEMIVVSIATDNTKDNELQGIRVYFELDDDCLLLNKLSDYADVYLCNDDYPFEDVDLS